MARSTCAASVRAALVLVLPAVVLIALAGSGSAATTGLSGLRWDPCQPITYRVNEAGGYAGSLADIQRAFRRIGRASGLTFVYDGPTEWSPYVTGRDPDANITLSWSDPEQVPRLEGDVAGLSRSWYVTHHRVRENVAGQVVFDVTEQLRPGFRRTGSPTWGQAYLHEIGHVVGLAHVDERTEVMYHSIGRYNHRLGRGDRSRLARIGIDGGCVRRSAR